MSVQERKSCTFTTTQEGNVQIGECVIPNQDHTLGNILRHALNKHRKVRVAAYRIPTPLEPSLIVEITTCDDAKKCLQDSIKYLHKELTTIENAFINAKNKKRSASFT